MLACLEKQPERRPQRPRSSSSGSRPAAAAGEWGEREARAWWSENAVRDRRAARGRRAASTSPLPTLAVSLEERLAGVAVER